MAPSRSTTAAFHPAAIGLDMLGGDLFPYGVKQNLAALQMVVDCSHQQGLTAEKADVVSLFAESTVDL